VLWSRLGRFDPAGLLALRWEIGAALGDRRLFDH
jgi:hypothetical protein